MLANYTNDTLGITSDPSTGKRLTGPRYADLPMWVITLTRVTKQSFARSQGPNTTASGTSGQSTSTLDTTQYDYFILVNAQSGALFGSFDEVAK